MISLNKIFLVLYNIETGRSFTKYFECEYDKDKFKRKIKFSKKIFVIEDSTDINYI